MGYTRQLGQLAYLITFDGSGNITVPASLTQGSVTSSMLKTDAGGKLVAAVAGTDFVAPAGLSAYVPTTRTLTINGTSYDLSADRSWTIVSGVSSFNTRTGAITLLDTDVTGALGYTPVTNARTLTINGTTYDLSANRSWSIVAGISSFNTRTGDITLLDTDVTGALGYTPVTNARTITINGTTYDLSANRTWVVDTSSVTTRVIQKFTATSSQTTFTITGGYTVGMVDVFLNGIKLDNATEFTASNGSTVVLALGAATGDIVEVYKYGGQFIANNTLRQSTLFTATAGQTTFTVNYSVGFVDVFYNGSKLDSSEFTATNGTSIVLGTACVLNDKVEVVAYNYTVGAFTGVGGSGTTNYISKWTASGTLNNSLIFDNGTGVGIGTSSFSGTRLAVQADWVSGQATIKSYPISSIASGAAAGYGIFDNDGTTRQAYFAVNSTRAEVWTTANKPLSLGTNDVERIRIAVNGNVGIGINPEGASTAKTLEIGSRGMIYDNNDNFTFVNNGYYDNAWRYKQTGAGVLIATNGGEYSFSTAVSGNQGTALTWIERMKISNAGRITTPYQPAFYAYGVSQGSYASNSYWVFPTTSFNRGNHYNTSTGVFTAPVTGVYEFTFANLGGTGTTVYRYFLYINNSQTQQGMPLQLRMDKGTTNGAYGTNFSRTAIVNLAANDTVRVFYSSDSGESSYPNSNDANNEYSVFMGKLLG